MSSRTLYPTTIYRRISTADCLCKEERRKMTGKGDVPPKEPMSLRLSYLYSSNKQDERDKKIQSYITEHCCHCPAFCEGNSHSFSSHCEDPLCVYIYWYYRHYCLKHKKVEPNTEPRSGCENCSMLYRWMTVHSSKCQNVQCCLSLCQQIKQSQHLLSLARADHNFMSHYHATSPQLPNSLPSTPNHQVNYSGFPHSLAGDKTLLSPQHYNNNDMSTQQLLKRQTYYNYTREQILPHHPSSSVNLNGQQERRQMLPSSHYHSQSCTNLPLQQNNFYSSGSDTLTVREAEFAAVSHNPRIERCYQQQQPQWALPQDPSPHSTNQVMSSTASLCRQNGSSVKATVQNQHSPTIYNDDVHAVNGVHAMDNIVPSSNTLATPTRDMKLSRWYSTTSSGYDTASTNTTGRLSVASNLSDQGPIIDDPEKSLQVVSAHPRKVSAPIGVGTRAKNMVNQQSKSLSSLSQDVPVYSYDNGESEHGECNGRPSLQRQDTGHSTKVVVAGLEDSISGEHYKSIMGMKRRTPKQTTLEEVSGSSPSTPAAKRPLQREQSDLSGRDKMLLGNGETRSGSNSLTREQYHSIFKFQEQHGILSDEQTREKVLDKQRKQAAMRERHQRLGTMSSDVQSDFDTESSTSDIPGSSPLTSSEFSELDQDLTDQEDEKKALLTKEHMSIAEQVQMIQDMKAGKMSLPVKMATHSELQKGRTRTTNMQHLNHIMQSPSLPPEMMSTYTPSSHPLHSLPQGSRHTTLISSKSSSSISDRVSTFETERSSNSTLKEEEYCYGSSRVSIGSCGPATHSSSDCSTLTGGSFEGLTSLRRWSNSSSERNKDALGMVNSPTVDSLRTSQSSLTQHHMQHDVQREHSVSYQMEMSQSDSGRRSYSHMQSDEIQSMDSDVCDRLSPVPAAATATTPFLPGRYKLASSQVQQMCQRVDDVKEKYHNELLRIRHKEKLMRQEAAIISDEEQQRTLPGYNLSRYGSSKLSWDHYSPHFPQSDFPEHENRYYKETLQQQFPENDQEVAEDLERRFRLKDYLLRKFHSGNAYREGAHWHRKTRLGKGGQAQCFSIQDFKTHMIMALKEEKEDSKTLDEAFVCMKLSYLSNTSPNIVDYYCAALLPKEYNLRRMSLVQVFMELVPACLHAYLQENGPFGNEDLHHFGYQLFDALDYLHSTLNIIHCDVKPANLLLDYTAQRLKLADFGFAQILDQYSTEVQSDENAGTLSYNPPEHYSDKRCSFALDIWQAGCTLLTMATGRRPWRHLFMDVVRKDQSPKFVQAVRRGQANMIGLQTGGHMYPAFLDDSLKKLLHGCLCHHPQSRLSTKDCIYQLALDETAHMSDQDKSRIINALGCWRSPPPVLSTYRPDDYFVDVYLDTARRAVIDGTCYTLGAGWLGCVPHQEGMTFEQLERDILPQHLPVLQHLSSFSLRVCENSPQALFMKANNHSVNLTFEPASPQSLVDRTKAVVI